jgi:hypothetical protein
MNSQPNPEEKLQRLLRLKRYEHPPEDFAEIFLEKFQRRQRSEILRRSTWSILGERFANFMQLLRRPAVLWTAGGAYAAVLLTLWLLPRPAPPGSTAIFLTGVPDPAAVNVDSRPVSPGARPVNSPTAPVPDAIPGGKRRTSSQDQDKEPIIGPEEREREEDGRLHDL